MQLGMLAVLLLGVIDVIVTQLEVLVANIVSMLGVIVVVVLLLGLLV